MTEDLNPTAGITTKAAAGLAGYSLARSRQLASKGTAKAEK